MIGFCLRGIFSECVVSEMNQACVVLVYVYERESEVGAWTRRYQFQITLFCPQRLAS